MLAVHPIPKPRAFVWSWPPYNSFHLLIRVVFVRICAHLAKRAFVMSGTDEKVWLGKDSPNCLNGVEVCTLCQTTQVPPHHHLVHNHAGTRKDLPKTATNSGKLYSLGICQPQICPSDYQIMKCAPSLLRTHASLQRIAGMLYATPAHVWNCAG